LIRRASAVRWEMRKDLLGLKDVGADDIMAVLDTARPMKDIL